MLSSGKGRLPSKVIFRQRLSSVKGSLPSKVVFCQTSSSIKGCLLSKVVFCQRLSSVKGCLLSKVVFCRRSSSVKGSLSSKVVYHQKSSSVRPRLVCLPPFWSIKVDRSTHNITIERWSPFLDLGSVSWPQGVAGGEQVPTVQLGWYFSHPFLFPPLSMFPIHGVLGSKMYFVKVVRSAQ